MLKIEYTAMFKKDFKTIKKRGYDISKLETVIDILCRDSSLPDEYYDHILSGKYSDFHECHIAPDWLLIYRINDEVLTLTLTRTGTHSDLF